MNEAEPRWCAEDKCGVDGRHMAHSNRVGLASYEQALDRALQEIRDTVVRRHRRYGHNLLRHGEYGIIVRIDDKTERIKNLMNQPDDVEEPRSQTWGDIAGYAAQAILIERGEFTLPMLS